MGRADFLKAAKRIRDGLAQGTLPCVEKEPKPEMSRGEKAKLLDIPPIFHKAQRRDFPFKGVREEIEVEDLLIQGDNGTGKSHLAAALAIDMEFRWFGVPKLMVKWNGAGFGRHNDIFDFVTSCPRVVLDDVTAFSKTDYGISVILGILDERVSHMRPTIVTTYQTLQQIDELDPSIASRLASFKRIVLTGSDRRLG
jgi:DNA replication protein DnaC